MSKQFKQKCTSLGRWSAHKLWNGTNCKSVRVCKIFMISTKKYCMCVHEKCTAPVLYYWFDDMLIVLHFNRHKHTRAMNKRSKTKPINERIQRNDFSSTNWSTSIKESKMYEKIQCIHLWITDGIFTRMFLFFPPILKEQGRQRNIEKNEMI